MGNGKPVYVETKEENNFKQRKLFSTFYNKNKQETNT
jgi:hypothetical protein